MIFVYLSGCLTGAQTPPSETVVATPTPVTQPNPPAAPTSIPKLHDRFDPLPPQCTSPARYENDRLVQVGISAFRHRNVILAAHPEQDGTLTTLAGCSLHSWGPDGVRLGTTPLKGCSEGSVGLFSPDGQWVAIHGEDAGDVWNRNGRHAMAVDHMAKATLCGGSVWVSERSSQRNKALRRIDLTTGEESVSYPRLSNQLLCVDDQWIAASNGYRIELDGSWTDTESPPPTTIHPDDPLGVHDDAALYDGSFGTTFRVAQDGTVAQLPPSLHHTTGMLRLDDGSLLVASNEVGAVHIDPAGRVAGGPHFVGTRSHENRHGGSNLLFRWQGVPWTFAGHVAFPVGCGPGPAHLADEDADQDAIFFGPSHVHICHGRRCEAYPLSADGPVGSVVLPTAAYTGQPYQDGAIGQEYSFKPGSPETTLHTDLLRGHVGTMQAPTEGTPWEGPDGHAWDSIEIANGHLALRYKDRVDIYNADHQIQATHEGRSDAIGPWGNGAWVAHESDVALFGPSTKSTTLHPELQAEALEDRLVGSRYHQVVGILKDDASLELHWGPNATARPTQPASKLMPSRHRVQLFLPGSLVQPPKWFAPTLELWPNDEADERWALTNELEKRDKTLVAIASFESGAQPLRQQLILAIQDEEPTIKTEAWYLEWHQAQLSGKPLSEGLQQQLDERGLQEATQVWSQWWNNQAPPNERPLDYPLASSRVTKPT